MFIATFRQGPVALDAFQAWASPPLQPVRVLTDNYVPEPSYDNRWRTSFPVDALGNVSTIVLTDAGTANSAGPQLLCLDVNAPTNGAWVVGRQGTAPPPNWSKAWVVAAAGNAGAGLASLPVQLMQSCAGPWYYLSAQVPPTNQAPTTTPDATTPGSIWTLVPVTPPDSAWLQLTVPALQNLTVEAILTQIWNRLVGSPWGNALTPGILTWMYDYPVSYPNQPTKWQADVQRYLGATLFTPYILENQPGFGDGAPPPISPPQPR